MCCVKPESCDATFLSCLRFKWCQSTGEDMHRCAWRKGHEPGARCLPQVSARCCANQLNVDDDRQCCLGCLLPKACLGVSSQHPETSAFLHQRKRTKFMHGAYSCPNADCLGSSVVKLCVMHIMHSTTRRYIQHNKSVAFDSHCHYDTAQCIYWHAHMQGHVDMYIYIYNYILYIGNYI